MTTCIELDCYKIIYNRLSQFSATLTCTCGPFECNCRWRPEVPVEHYPTSVWTPMDHQSYPNYQTQPGPSLPPEQSYDATILPADDIFHPEEIFQLDQPIRLDFPVEENTMESPPTFADLNDNSRPEECYWLEWQRAPGGSESSETPSPELFNNSYPQNHAYCDQQFYGNQVYCYQDDGQYYHTENARDPSPILETIQDSRYYRNEQDCSQTVEMQGWNYTDCAFTSQDLQECKQYYDAQHTQSVNTFGALL